MGKVLVFHRDGEYSWTEMPVINFSTLKESIGGWVERAIVVHKSVIGKYLPGCDGELGVVLFCDEEGRLKNLPITCVRPTDGAPIVGKVIWVAYKEVWTPDGADEDYLPLSEKHMAGFKIGLDAINWGERVLDENSEGADILRVFNPTGVN